MKTLLKLHLCCANDELRPIMNHLLVTKEFIVASNSHILIEFKTEEIFDPEFIEKMPDRFLIHYKNWLILTKKHLHLDFEDSKIKVLYGERDIFIPIVTEEELGKYPKYETLLEEKNSFEINKIGIQPELLNKLSLAIGSKVLHLFFSNENKSITIKSNIEGFRALIMPAMIHD